MSGDQTRIRARLAAGLDDASAIETRPIEEIRAELARLGIDPRPSTRLAQKLAKPEAGSPAARLLGRIERSEDVDAEIAALERASIEEVEASLPSGRTVRVSALQRPKRSSNTVELRRRRLSVLGFGGSIMGVAACVLLFIAIRPDRLPWIEAPPASIENQPFDLSTAAPVEADGAALSGLAERREAPVSSKAVGRLDTERRRPARAAASTIEEAEAADEVSPVPAPEAAGFPLPEALTGVLLVDADRAPPILQNLAGTLPGEVLRTRLADARRYLQDRSVVALVAFERDGREVQAALVESGPMAPEVSDRLAPSITAFDALVESGPAPQTSPGTRFTLVELP